MMKHHLKMVAFYTTDKISLKHPLFEEAEDDLRFHFAYKGLACLAQPTRQIHEKFASIGWNGTVSATGIFIGKKKARELYKSLTQE